MTLEALGPSALRAVGGALAIALVSTLADVLWYEWPLPHRAVYGLAHGAILFFAVGLVLGAACGRAVMGGISACLIGLAAAGAFYLLAPLFGYAVMFVIWMGIWMALAWLVERLGRTGGSWSSIVVRGGLAAVGSGLAFYAISGIWLGRHPEGRNYLVHFLSWTLAYLPAFLALVAGRRRSNGL